MWQSARNDGEYLFLVAIAQPTLPWAINDTLPDLYNENPKATLLTPADKRVQAVDWSSGGKPVVLEHAGIVGARETTPEDAMVGRIVGGMVDRRENLLALLELRLTAPGIAEIEDALRNQRPVGVSLMTRRFLGSTRKEVEHLGVTFTPAFGIDGSWTMEWATDAAAFRERMRLYYGQEPGLFIPEELRAHLRQFETQDSEYLKRIRAYRERLTGGNVDSWKSQLHPTIVVMASDAMDLDPPAAPASTPVVAAPVPAVSGAKPSGRIYTPTSLQDHLMRIQSQPMVEKQIEFADDVLQCVEKEHRENPYRLGDPDGRKASELVEAIEKLRQQKDGVSKRMLTAAIERGFLSPEAQHVIDRLRDPSTAAEARTLPYANQLATFVAASGQLHDETLAKLEKSKVELDAEKVKNQRSHEVALEQKRLADQRTKELEQLQRRLEDNEKTMAKFAEMQKERDAKLDALAAASSVPAAQPVQTQAAVIGVTASDAESVRREKTGTPARHQGSVMAASLEEAFKLTKAMPTPQTRPTDVISSISFAVSATPSTVWKLGEGSYTVTDMSRGIRVNQ